jgi:ethanolamine permease
MDKRRQIVPAKPPRGLVQYENVGREYLEQRRLRRSAGWVLLWALGVGAVISGDFFGWNFGLAVGGFWGLTIATVLMAVMYVCMVYSIAELSAALPHAGGFYSFTRNAFGPLGGFLCGVTDTIEYVVSPAVVVVAIGGYCHALMPAVPVYGWWLLAYTLFVAINIRGAALTLKVGLIITLLAAAVLTVFFVGALATGAFKPGLLFNVPPDPGQSATGLAKGGKGIFAALPYAIWFFLAIEQLPLAAEEAHDVVRDIPRALTWGIFTLLILSLLTLVLNSGVAGGAVQIGKADAPLVEGFKAVFGRGATSLVLTLFALTGLVASFHTIIYAYGRVLFSLSRAGYFPRWISVSGRRQTPARALIAGAVIGLICAIVIQRANGGAVGAALLNVAVSGAVISYALVMFSYIKLQISRPDLPRPYQSPLGIGGAALGAGLALVAFFACFSDPSYRPAVWATVIFLIVSSLYFLLHSRKRLVAQAPEEEVALMFRSG